MGICSKAKEVICCNKMTDIPIYQDNNNNNSFDSKKLYSQKVSEEKNEVEIDINKPAKERINKFFGTVKEESKNPEIIEIKRFTVVEKDNNDKEENDKEKQKVKVKLKSLLKNGHTHDDNDKQKLNLNENK